MSEDTLAKILRQNGCEFPHEDALREKKHGIWTTWTWAQYADAVKELALGLAAMGFERGDKLAVIGDNRPRLYMAMMAAQSLGGISVAVYQDAIAKELGFVLAHAEVRYIVAEDEEQIDKLYEIKDRLGYVDKVIYDDPRGLQLREDPWLVHLPEVEEQGREYGKNNARYFETQLSKGNGEDVCVFCYTSGTTGNPKGVMLTNDNLLSTIRETMKAEDLRTGDELIAYLPMAWVGDYWLSVGAAITIRMTVNCPENRDTLQRDYREIGPTIVVAPPAAWEGTLTRIQVRMDEADWLKRALFNTFMEVALKVERMRQRGAAIPAGLALRNCLGEWLVRRPLRDLLGMTRVRRAYTGGAPLGPDVFDYLRAVGLNLKQFYGMTESCSACVYQPEGEANSETVGRALDITQVKISEAGEILLRGPNIFAGYHKNEEATRNTIDADGWMASGDAGFVDDRGHIRVIDRAKDVSKLADGTLFAPQFLENKLKFSPYIKEAVIFGKELDYVAAMINIDLDAMENWAERKGVAYTGYQDLSQKAAVHDLVRGEVERINAGLAQDSELAGTQIQRFLVLNKELDADDGEITRTRKIRRNVISERYGALIEALYSDADRVETDIVVTYEDGRSGQIHADLRVMSVAAASVPARAA
ncbi:MAG: AMP-binding protein [Gammaproteobacteria bacterium]|nr:AMP-binding protein [Gammaproteobacteria bacterium]